MDKTGTIQRVFQNAREAIAALKPTALSTVIITLSTSTGYLISLIIRSVGYYKGTDRHEYVPTEWIGALYYTPPRITWGNISSASSVVGFPGMNVHYKCVNISIYYMTLG